MDGGNGNNTMLLSGGDAILWWDKRCLQAR